MKDMTDDLQRLAALHHLQMPCAMWYSPGWCEQWLSAGGLGEASATVKRISVAASSNARTVNCTCSLVSTSGALLQQELGTAVDEADLVVRVGLAPTRGYVRHVGSRTNIRYLHPSKYPEYVRGIGSHEPVPTFLWLLESDRLEAMKALQTALRASPTDSRISAPMQLPLLPFKRNRSATASRVMCSYFGKRKCEHAYANGRPPMLHEVRFLLGLHSHHRGYGPDEGYVFGEGQMPSSGLIALHHLLSRGVCSSVRLFGFDHSNLSGTLPYHYYHSESLVNATQAYHYLARKVAGRHTNHARWEPFDWAMTQRMGHNFEREHDVMRAVSNGTWVVQGIDYLRHLAGLGGAWQRLATRGGSSEPDFWRQHVPRLPMHIVSSDAPQHGEVRLARLLDANDNVQ